MGRTSSGTSAARRVGAGAAVALLVAALAVTVAIGVIRGATAPAGEIVVESSATMDALSPRVYVHVSGAVRAPGLYALDAGARVVDAVAAAGGFSADAEPAGVNLARPVTDGEQLSVPALGDEAMSGVAPVDGTGRVNINSADGAALESLPGIGPALASRIIAWREDNGPFASPDDLAAVSGIGQKLLDALRDLVTV